MNQKILCVDDEPHVLNGLRRQLFGKFEVELAEGPQAALEMLESSGPYAVVLSDMRMPGMDGAELLAVVRERYPDTTRMMLTGNSDLLTAIRAVNEGNIFRFLNKPCEPDDLVRALADGLEQNRLVRAEREILEETLSGCVEVLSEVLSLADPHSFQDNDGIKEIAEDVARALGMPNPWELPMAVMFAQLGRVAIPPEVIAKEAESVRLTTEERRMFANVPSAGAELIARIPRLEGVARIVERQAWDFDPENLEDPPLGSRVLRVLQEMTQMGTSGLGRDKALACMGSDPQFDPRVVEALASCLGLGLQESVGPLQITFDALRAGDILAAPLVTSDGRLLMREGQRVGQVLMERLRNHQQMSGFREPIHVEQRSLDDMCHKRRAS